MIVDLNRIGDVGEVPRRVLGITVFPSFRTKTLEFAEKPGRRGNPDRETLASEFRNTSVAKSSLKSACPLVVKEIARCPVVGQVLEEGKEGW